MTHNSIQFVISIMSRDRIGIVYQVSSAISELRGDISDLRQSVLRSYFTMILLASFPSTVTLDQVRQRLQAIDDGHPSPFEVAIQQVDSVRPDNNHSFLENAYVLTASGPDRIGFVAAVSRFCADHRLNILDLSTAVRDGAYTMILLVDLEACADDIGAIRLQLRRFGEENALDVVLQHYDIFSATNEVSIL